MGTWNTYSGFVILKVTKWRGGFFISTGCGFGLIKIFFTRCGLDNW